MTSKFRNVAVATGIAGSLMAAGIGIASAQSATTTTVKPSVSSGTSSATAQADRSARVAAALAPLVKAGTITQAQADAVAKALTDAGAVGGRGGHGMGGPGMGGLGRGMDNHADTIAAAIGISVSDLQTALQSGKTIAQVATAKGVSVQKVIDAYVAEEKQEHPEMPAADITARVTAIVNGTAPAGGPGMGGGMGGGHGRGRRGGANGTINGTTGSTGSGSVTSPTIKGTTASLTSA